MATRFQHGLIIGSSVTLPTGLANGVPIFALSLSAYPTALAAASGTVIQRWRAQLPGVQTKLYGIGMTFTHGGTHEPQGGTLRFKAWSTTVGKGLFSASVAGVTADSVSLTPTSAPTFPANALLQLSIHTAGATQAGSGAQPTCYFGLGW